MIKARGGDDDARNKLIEHNLRLVVFLAKKYESTGYDLEDLVSIGSIGLNRGKTVLSGNLKEIKDSYETNKVLIETTDEIDGILKRLKVDLLDKNDDEYLVSTDADNRRKLLKELVKNNIDVKTFKVIKPTLHEIFIEKVGE